jgi:hypothetical protein
VRTLECAGDAGTAFDGTHLYQIAEARIDKIDPATGEMWHRSPRPATAATRASPGPRAACGWGSTAIARSTRSIPESGAVLRTIESNRFVTGVTWVDGELWHGTWEGDESDIRRIDPDSGAVLERLRCRVAQASAGSSPTGQTCFICGGGSSGKVRAVRRPQGDNVRKNRG